MKALVSYTKNDAMHSTIVSDVSDLQAKIDAVVRERGGIPILAHTLEGKKVCLHSSDCMNCDPERCVCRS